MHREDSVAKSNVEICFLFCKYWGHWHCHYLQIASAPDLNGGGPGAQTWWEAPCADTNV